MHARIMQLVLATIALGALGMGLMHMRDDERERGSEASPASSPVALTNAAPAVEVDVADESSLYVAPVEDSEPLAPEEVARLVADTGSGDASTRAAAILALADAPKSEAIAALRRVVEGGEPSIDRPLALRSLRDLALHQGDEDGAIRSVVRETIYHADDDALIERAQSALEIIEESEMGRASE